MLLKTLPFTSEGRDTMKQRKTSVTHYTLLLLLAFSLSFLYSGNTKTVLAQQDAPENTGIVTDISATPTQALEATATPTNMPETGEPSQPSHEPEPTMEPAPTGTDNSDLLRTMTFDSDGGTKYPPVERMKGELWGIILPTPVKEGYTFDSWYNADTGTKCAADRFLEWKVNNNFRLIAKWIPNSELERTMSFDSDGGTEYPPVERMKGELWGITLPTPEKKGYVFAYWYNADTGTKCDADRFLTWKVNNNFKLKAKWNLANYTITYQLKGGSLSYTAPTNYTMLSDTIKLVSPVRAKYTFEGWYTNSNYSSKKFTSIPKGSTGNVTLYAKWKKVQPDAVTIKSVSNPSGKLTINLKKVSGIKGYEIKISTNKDFKTNTATYDIGSKTSLTYAGAAKKTYYIKARAYALDSTGAKRYGSYGKTVRKKVTKAVKEYTATSTSAKISAAKALSSKQIQIKATVKKRVKSSDDFYYLVKLNPHTNKVEKSIKKVFKEKSINIKLPIDGSNVGNLLNKYAIAIKENGKYKLISSATYITNPEKSAVNTAARFTPASKKGLQGATVSDLGSKNTLWNLDLKYVISTNNSGTPFVYNGKTYYFNAPYTDLVRSWNSQGISVSMVVLLSWDDNLTYLIHPSARVRGKAYYTLNTTEKTARETLEAAFAFIGQAYGTQDCYVSNWILGNEINAHKVWNYAGNLSLDAYAKSYAQAFQMLYYGVKHGYGNTRCYVSLDHAWNRSTNGFSSKSMLTAFASALKAENSKVEWNLAFHAYPTPLTAPDFWNNAGVTTNVNTTPYITPKNLEVLTKYIKKTYGKNTRIILSEQGFTSTKGQSIQAAALAYSYYKAEFNDMIDAVIYRCEYDAPEEVAQGLAMGMMTDAMTCIKKEAYNVYKYMDTPSSETYTKPYLKTIGASSWKSIVPNYKASKFKSMPKAN